MNPLQASVSGENAEEPYSKRNNHTILVAIFILAMILPFMGCESGGTVGGGIDTDDEGIEVNTFEISEARVIHDNTYSGRLAHTPAGHVVDPLYGTIRSTALIKPMISRANLDTLQEDDKMLLQLIFSEDVYGPGLSEEYYEIYEVADIWRGNQLRYNQEVEVNFSQKVGEFQVLDSDSITVELSDEWKNKFAGYFNSQEANRDSLYRNNFTGLAIVPSSNNRNLRFLRTGRDPDQPDLSVSKFLVKSPASESDDDSDDENDSDEEIAQLELRDWGALFVRSDIPVHNSGYILHNAETVLEIISSIPFEQFSSKNITNAQLILTKNSDFEQTPTDFERLSPDLVQIHVFEDVPSDLMGEIYISDPNFFKVKEEDEETFRIDITQYVIDQAYGEENGRNLYLTTQLVNGFLYSANFYDHNAPADLKPRIVITTIR